MPRRPSDSSANATTTTATLTGTVSYLQRIALLPGAVIEVQQQDSTGAVVASQTLTTTNSWSTTPLLHFLIIP